MRLTTALAAIVLLGARALPVSAQQLFTPGAEVNGQINVQVNATLNDEIGEYNPLPELLLTLYRGATDSLQLRTDDAGVLRFAVKPGTYRLATAAPIQYHGRSYRWNIPLPVARGMGIVNLTAENASVTAASVAVRGTARARANESAGDAGYDRKSGTVSALLSVLVTGGGQMYAGKVNKGIGLLATGIAGGVLTVVSANDYDKNVGWGGNTAGPTAGMVAGLSLSLGTYIYSIATANRDVHEYNAERHPISVAPILDQHDGRTGLGLAVTF